MFIEINKKDILTIVNKNLQGEGGNSELELALAKKCLNLYEKLGNIKNERNTLFEAIYSIRIKIDKAAGDHLKNKRIHDLQAQSKADFAHATKLDHELKEILNGSSENQD